MTFGRLNYWILVDSCGVLILMNTVGRLNPVGDWTVYSEGKAAGRLIVLSNGTVIARKYSTGVTGRFAGLSEAAKDLGSYRRGGRRYMSRDMRCVRASDGCVLVWDYRARMFVEA